VNAVLPRETNGRFAREVIHHKPIYLIVPQPALHLLLTDRLCTFGRPFVILRRDRHREAIDRV